MKIVTDSAADLTQDEIESLDITVAPLEIQFPEGPVFQKISAAMISTTG